MSPSVITSKAAQKDFLDIKSQHADILTGYANQKIKLDAISQQKQAEMAAQNTMNAELQKEKMVSDTQQQKNALDFAQKQSELDIKRAALSAG